MIQVENQSVQISGTNAEIYTELGAILYTLCENLTKEMGELVTPDRLALVATKIFMEKIEEQMEEATNE